MYTCYNNAGATALISLITILRSIIPFLYFFFIPKRSSTCFFFFFLNDPPPPEISPLPLHAALPIPRRAAHYPPVKHDPGAEARAGRQHDQRAGAPAGAEHPLAERERVDVVVHEYGQAEPLAELGGERPAGEPGHVGYGLADPPGNRIHGSGHADADGGERPAAAFGLCAEGRGQPGDRRGDAPPAAARR